MHRIATVNVIANTNTITATNTRTNGAKDVSLFCYLFLLLAFGTEMKNQIWKSVKTMKAMPPILTILWHSPPPPDSHGLLWCRNRTDQTPTIPISSLRQSIRLPVSHESVVYLKGCAVRCYLPFEALDFRLFPILFSDADSGFGWPEVFIFCKPKQTLAEIFLILVFGNTDPRGRRLNLHSSSKRLIGIPRTSRFPTAMEYQFA